MPRKRGPGGGKTDKAFTYRPSVEQLERWKTLVERKSEVIPALRTVAITTWMGDLIGFEQKDLIEPADRFYLRGLELSASEQTVINNLGQIMESWPNLSEKDQKLFAVRIESLLEGVMEKAAGNEGSEQKPSRITKHSKAQPKRTHEIKSKTA